MSDIQMENRELKHIIDEQSSNIDMLVKENEKLQIENAAMKTMLDNIHAVTKDFPKSPMDALESLEAAKFYSDRKVMDYWTRYYSK